ncbi:MAG: Rieske (2Fe-2S) protein [Actinobacteria bacterium]|nr:Rieske (2Fe-2S) protein [Actinomycetota bacterium]
MTDSDVMSAEAFDESNMDKEDNPVDHRAYQAAIISFVVATLGGLAATYGYWSEDSEMVLGLGLATALLGIGFGLVWWSKYLDLDENVVQERHSLRSTVEEREDFHEEVEMTVQTVGRRKLLTLLFAGSIGTLALGFIGPIGSLGPRKGSARGGTSWAAGSRLVTSSGEPILAAAGGFDQLATVFPDGAIGVDDSQVVLLRVRPGLFTERTVEGGTADGWVAYSKICTHAGCSVGLFGIDDRPPQVLRQLVCPCHQSVFDPLDAAKPVGGPAPRSLPQLAIAVDDDGFLIAQSDFDRPVGPISWLEG